MMHADGKIVELATRAQLMAADVEASVWVSAHAGTGKTTVLTQRMLRLLLQHDPREIVALTFTTTAAMEMLARLRKVLGAWALAPEDIASKLEDVLGRVPTDAEVARAQGLYDVILDTPPQVTNMHGFCQQILQQFPLEAGVPVGFEVLAPEGAMRLLKAAFYEALREDDTVLMDISEDALWAAVQQGMGLEGFDEARLAAVLGVPVATGWGDVVEEIGPEVEVKARLEESLDAFEAAGGKAAETVGRYRAWVVGKSTYASIFLNADGQAYKVLGKAAVVERFPIWLEEQARVVGLWADYTKKLAFVRTRGILRMVARVKDIYASKKQALGGVDFDDLVEKTRLLLTDTESAAWVRYKLDQRIAHVLVDEAQDTNWAQKAVVDALTGEFFSGESAVATPRTLFVVGDEKQSIFRFQGAQPPVFQGFWQDMERGGGAVQQVEMQVSFRSSPAVLEVVDAVTDETHVSAFPGRFGGVYVWPVCQVTQEAEEVVPWALPTPQVHKETGWGQVAKRVAETAKQLAEREKVTLACKGGAVVDYGDMLVLLRQRTHLPEILRAFYQAGVPVVVSGGDKDGLAHPIVQDVLALLKFKAQPSEDWTLFHLLKSPFCNCTDEDVLAVYPRAEGETLWQAVQARGQGELAAAVGFLRDVLAQDLTASGLVQWALHQTEGRGAFASRFGGRRTLAETVPEAVITMVNTVIDAVIAQLGVVERGAVGLDGVLLALGETGVVIPALADTKGAVQVMTVHGAKGLEAPIVFLPDTMGGGGRSQDVFVTHETDGKPDGMLYLGPKHERCDLHRTWLAEEKERQQADEERLLYVALTRAQERLYVGGVLPANRQQVPKQSWYGLLEAARTKMDGWTEVDGVWVWEG